MAHAQEYQKWNWSLTNKKRTKIKNCAIVKPSCRSWDTDASVRDHKIRWLNQWHSHVSNESLMWHSWNVCRPRWSWRVASNGNSPNGWCARCDAKWISRNAIRFPCISMWFDCRETEWEWGCEGMKSMFNKCSLTTEVECVRSCRFNKYRLPPEIQRWPHARTVEWQIYAHSTCQSLTLCKCSPMFRHRHRDYAAHKRLARCQWIWQLNRAFLFSVLLASTDQKQNKYPTQCCYYDYYVLLSFRRVWIVCPMLFTGECVLPAKSSSRMWSCAT